MLCAVAGLAGWLSTPKLAILIFLALPVFYGITSEGLTENTALPAVRKSPSPAFVKSGHERVHAE
jgi:hypothetical protein